MPIRLCDWFVPCLHTKCCTLLGCGVQRPPGTKAEMNFKSLLEHTSRTRHLLQRVFYVGQQNNDSMPFFSQESDEGGEEDDYVDDDDDENDDDDDEDDDDDDEIEITISGDDDSDDDIDIAIF